MTGASEGDRNGAGRVAGVLYVVATPIGNLEDLSPRAARVLREADLIAAEDTRRTRALLSALGLRKRLVSYYDAIEERRSAELVAELQRGAAVALVSDAGTPLVSDPGFRLVESARRRGVRVVAVPGPSAVLALLSCAGLPAVPFTFVGFLPARRPARRRVLVELRDRTDTLVCFESARRLAASLADMSAVFGEREAAVGRELTKRHEEVLRGSLPELAARFAASGPPKGEIVVAIAGGTRAAAREARAEGTERLLRSLLAAGVSVSEAARRAAAESGLSRRELYGRALALARAAADAGPSPTKREKGGPAE